MSLDNYLSWLVTGSLVVVVILLALGGTLGQPVLLGYVETGSMSPTLKPGDGFIAVPMEISGEIQQGDVVVFRADVIHDGGLVTHRVVEKTEHGYITKGDANPIADQSGSGEPPVNDEQVVAKVFQFNGHVVAIPHFGTVVDTTRTAIDDLQRHTAGFLGTRFFLGSRGLMRLVSLLFLALFIVSALREQSTRGRTNRNRESSRSQGTSGHLVVVVFVLLIIMAVTLGMVVPSRTHEFRVIKSGTETATLTVENGAFIPMVTYLSPGSDAIRVTPERLSVPGRSSKDATVTISPPTGINDLRRYLVERRYFSLLPRAVLDDLYNFHPWAPIVVIDALVGVPFYLLGLALVGTGRIRDRSRSRDLPIAARIRRTLRSLY